MWPLQQCPVGFSQMGNVGTALLRAEAPLEQFPPEVHRQPPWVLPVGAGIFRDAAERADEAVRPQVGPALVRIIELEDWH